MNQLMEKWDELSLGDVITLQRGFDITKKEQHDGPYYVISSSGFNSKHSEYKVEGPGVVVGRKGSIGTVYFIEENYWPHDTTLWVKDFKGNDPKFVYYFLKTLSLEKYDVGASNPTLNRNHIHKLDILWPDFPIQQKIASILSAFDDLIENNTRRIEILEEMARHIYREWFVHFRYPGHERDRLVDSGTELGKIPEEWKIEKVDDVIETLGGGTPRRKNDEYWDNGTITWYTPSDLTAEDSMFMDQSSEKINELGLKKSSAKVFPAHSVMMTSRATIGVISINTTVASTNQGFITCIPNERLNKYQIYFWLHEQKPLIEKLASGATYKEINKSTFRDLDLVVPPEDLSNSFFELIDPLGEQILNLLRKNKKLKETRDLLLPKLISGKIEV